jgi:hypothetical protein
MQSNEMKVLFSGFEPTADMRSSLYYILNRLHLKSPSQSLLSATFTMTNGLFEGVVKVTSTAENFVVKATDAALPALGQKLFEKVGEKLENWRALRFD